MPVARTAVTGQLELIHSVFRERPDFRLSRGAMQRLWGWDGYLCDALLGALVSAHALKHVGQDTYVIRHDGPWAPPRAASRPELRHSA
jgi:hypothetical protein